LPFWEKEENTVTQRYTHSNVEMKRRAVENLAWICHLNDARFVEPQVESISQRRSAFLMANKVSMNEIKNVIMQH